MENVLILRKFAAKKKRTNFCPALDISVLYFKMILTDYWNNILYDD